MERREFIKKCCLGLSALSMTVLGKTSCKKDSSLTSKPNIIFIMADDLGYGELGCYGQKIIRTPNIDKLALEGMKFTQHYSGSPVCAPSRCVLMTGKHTGHSYIRNNGRPKGRKHNPEQGIFAGQNPIPESEITISELFKKQGYATAVMGKWGLGAFETTGDPNKHGFDLFYGYNCQVHAHNHYPRFLWRNSKKETLEGNSRTLTGKQYSQDLFIKEAKQFINQNQNRPFFLYLPFVIPHLGIQVAEESLKEYTDKIPEKQYEHRGYFQHPSPRAGYAAMISHMDKGIGEIMELLKELVLDENTIVVFTSDNGPTYNRLGGSDSDYFESKGHLRGYKGDLYEGGIRVPFIARWIGHIDEGTSNDHVCAFWDVMPTICEITNTSPPSGIDGISFLPTLLGKKGQKNHDYLYWEFPAYGGQQAVRFGDWKAIRTGLKKHNSDTSVQLYDLKKDLGEKNNVAEKHPDIVKKVSDIMQTTRTESELFPFPEIYSRDI